jgi:hypothetical protein
MTTLLGKVDYAKTLWATWFADHNLAKPDDVFFTRALSKLSIPYANKMDPIWNEGRLRPAVRQTLEDKWQD